MKTVWLRGDGRLVHSIDAAPQSLDEALPVIKPVMANCKNCHEDFRIEDRAWHGSSRTGPGQDPSW
jgi:hypothetical protein